MITKDQIQHLAKLSKLKLSEGEIEKLSEDLSKILAYVQKINELNLENLDPLINILERLDWREDIPEAKDSFLITANFPEKEDNYLKVPKILEK